ncbi:hypothetical protein GCM10028822_11400 [Hymenobacter terrigena]
MDTLSTGITGGLLSTFSIYCLIITALSGCHLLAGPSTSTVVEGTIINKYTRQPLANVPIEVIKWRYGAYGNTQTDSVAGTRSGPDGHFSIAFDGTAKGVTYRVDFRDSRELFDLTDYRPFDAYSTLDGASLIVGKSNEVRFEATPYVLVRVLVDTNKRGATSLAVGFFSNESTDYGGGYWGSVLYDTTRTVQRIMETHIVRAVPNRKYRFLLTRAIIVRLASGQIRTDNEISEGFDHFVGYNDTTVVSLH